MKHCPSGVRALAVASAALSIAVVTFPTLLIVARRRGHGFRCAGTTSHDRDRCTGRLVDHRVEHDGLVLDGRQHDLLHVLGDEHGGRSR